MDQVRFQKDGTGFVPLPDPTHVIVALDTAISEKDTADWNACIVWGVWSRPELETRFGGNAYGDPMSGPKFDPWLEDDGQQPRVIMMGGWRRRTKLNDETLDRDGLPRGLVQRLIATAQRFEADAIVIENKTRGIDVKNEIERQLAGVSRKFQIELFEPRKHGDKAARLHSVQPLFSQKLVYAPALCQVILNDEEGYLLPEPRIEVKEYQWVRDVMKEVEAVPRGLHDDYADCVSMGLITLREGGYLDLIQEFARNRVWRRRPRKPYTKVVDHYGVG